jgi:hypothetical protein
MPAIWSESDFNDQYIDVYADNGKIGIVLPDEKDSQSGPVVWLNVQQADALATALRREVSAWEIEQQERQQQETLQDAALILADLGEHSLVEKLHAVLNNQKEVNK